MSRLFTKPRKQPAKAARPVRSPVETAVPADPVTADGLAILRLSHEGRGVARNTEGKAVFVEGALPGERVTCKVRFTRSRYDEAVVDAVLASSPQRSLPQCAHYAACGGCNLQHLSAEGQRAFKQSRVAELMELSETGLQPALVSPAYAYRRKARLGVKWRKDGRLLLGFREKASAYLTNIIECPVLVPELQALLPDLHELLPQLVGGQHLGHIELIRGQNQTGLLVRLLRPLARLDSQDRQRWQAWAAKRQVQLLLQDDTGIHRLDGQPEVLFEDHLQGLALAFSATDFVQVNPEINPRMVAQALDWLDLQGQERVLDLFCGYGNFTLPLAQWAAEVLGVEGLETQVQRARDNASRNGLENLTFEDADLSRPLAQQGWARLPDGDLRTWDVILLDPPRAGAAGIVAQLGELGAKKILYVSCDPATLARDALILQQQGYVLERLGIMDMFPQTAHVESMALFTR